MVGSPRFQNQFVAHALTIWRSRSIFPALNILMCDLQASLDATAMRLTSGLVSRPYAAKFVAGQKKRLGENIFLSFDSSFYFELLDALNFSLLFQAPYAMSWMFL